MTDPRFAAAPAPTPGPWQQARVVAITQEAPNAKTFRLALPNPVAHLPGQHYVVRLTAPDGYRAQRSYSVASAPEASGEIELTVERLPDGEVSGFLHDALEVGDELEVRGPIGGWFVWRGGEPALLVGGGSGLVPLMAMVRHARALGRADLLQVVVSVRTPAELYYAAELVGPDAPPSPAVTVVHTRVAPPGSARPAGRLSAADLPAVGAGTTVYVCGSNGFADAATDLLLAAGTPTEQIRVERFGATA
ncbi:ferredoxin reductase [Aquihabitans sp. G128]|uniref:ferredoxin reductase n=1 Tax=Aquihabitans sp. G128 TaxID=2849779 RepID=UPI001C24AD89|nr:ferredoxin reductase [Aquihabitans sp. G128]QXC60729.1 ferredoxin reductase [Aquihabitans sp. G128]